MEKQQGRSYLLNYSYASSVDISDPDIPPPHVLLADLPYCLVCGTGILRPDIVWFGEPPPEMAMIQIYA